MRDSATVQETDRAKLDVLEFWQDASCGEAYAQGETLPERLAAQAAVRYEMEPYIFPFARFHEGAGKDVLEIGVGMGADHLQWAKAAPRTLTGIDLTPQAVEYTRARLEVAGYSSDLQVADAEALPFADVSFDIVYSWGVLHHSPDTPQAIREVQRVLRPGGVARVMVYHTHSIVGFLLYLRYGLLAGNPRRSLSDIYTQHLESPGTKAYTVSECRRLFVGFSDVSVNPQLSFGDLLQGDVGQRHRSHALTVAKRAWPRWLLRRAANSFGLYLLIAASKGVTMPATDEDGG